MALKNDLPKPLTETSTKHSFTIPNMPQQHTVPRSRTKTKQEGRLIAKELMGQKLA